MARGIEPPRRQEPPRKKERMRIEMLVFTFLRFLGDSWRLGGSIPLFLVTWQGWFPRRPLTMVRPASIMGARPGRGRRHEPPRSEGPDFFMRALPSHSPSNRLAGRLLPAIALMLACAFCGEIGAATVSVAQPFDADSHAKACKCGPKCRGASCCCGSSKLEASPRPKTSTPSTSTPRTSPFDSPCLNSAPCRDPISPPSASAGSSGKVAAFGTSEPSPIPVGRRLLPSRSSRLPSDRRASRLDRPPRVTEFA